MRILSRTLTILTYLFFGYLCFLLLLATPYFQRGAIYLHWIRLPLNAKFNAPEKYGILPGKVRNFYLTTPDGATIGVWHSMPEALYIRYLRDTANSTNPVMDFIRGDVPQSVFDTALKTHKTVLYSHGNAGSRALSFRTSYLRTFTNPTYGACDEGMNFVTYDYRGFADSSPSSKYPPSEKGLIIDAKTVWDWILNTGASPNNVTIMGQSLGTGVSTSLAYKVINEQNLKPNALCLIAPFSSITDLLRTYSLFRVIPILKPLSLFPRIQAFFLNFLNTRFDTKSLISSIDTSIILIHAQDDTDIPFLHSRMLFDRILETSQIHKPKVYDKDRSTNVQIPFTISFDQDYKTNQISEFGEIHSFYKINQNKSLEIDRVIYIDALRGGHNRVGYSETASRTIVDSICRATLEI